METAADPVNWPVVIGVIVAVVALVGVLRGRRSKNKGKGVNNQFPGGKSGR